MTTAIVADDEPHALASLIEALKLTWPDLQLLAAVEDGPQAYQAIQQHGPDIAFLDIRMPGMTGLQVAELVADQTRVVFVTAHDDYALQAFERGVIDYVLKPVELARLASGVRRIQGRIAALEKVDVGAMMNVLSQVSSKPMAAAKRLEWIKASVGNHVKLIHVDDVDYFESDAKYTRVVTSDGDAIIRTTLKQLAEQLDERWFWQVHRSAVVNVRAVAGVHRKDETMEVAFKARPERIKVSTQYQPLFRQM